MCSRDRVTGAAWMVIIQVWFIN